MSWQQLYAWSKKIHRLTMWLMILLGVPQAVTGVLLEDGTKWRQVLGRETMGKVLELHAFVGSKFAIILAVMMVTGVLMWLLPELQKRKRKPGENEGLSQTN